MRLIDADALMYAVDGNPLTTDSLKEYVRSTVKAQPTVDAVPIIRCRECRWGRETCGNIECHVDLNIPSEYHGYDWYCPNGERKEHETD